MTFSAVFVFDILILILAALTRVFSILYIVFSCKHYNEDLSIGLCVLAVFFPLIAVIIQLSRKKHFQGEGLKVCRQCGEKLPPSYEVCPRCLAPLEPYDEIKTKKSKMQSNVMLAVFSVSKAVLIVCMVVFIGTCFKTVLEIADEGIFEPQRISVTVDGKEVYLDKYGNSYDDADDVVLYSKDGTKYVYDDEYSIFVSDKNEEYESICCFVDSDGWFYYDGEDTLNYKTMEDEIEDYYAQDDNISDVGLDELFSKFFSSLDSGVWYDDDGNLYYEANTASWNEKGELITVQYEAMP
ncbi:MAG: hypothetical protein ACI4XE_00450 [Acutalibacteraceae bacterium]